MELLAGARVRATVACRTPISATVRVASGRPGGVPVLPGVEAVGGDTRSVRALCSRPSVRDALAVLFAFAPKDARVEVGRHGVRATGPAAWLTDDSLDDGVVWLVWLARAVEGRE